MDLEDLESADGKDGRPAHILYRGRVYDVSGSRLWMKGLHMNLHQAGRDLTDQLPMAPHGPEVFSRVPEVGWIESASREEVSPPPEDLKESLSRLYKKVHPHPISIHFPIALFIFSAFLDILYLLLGRQDSLAVASFYAFLFASIATPASMATGFLSWWLNYGSTLTPTFAKKIAGSTTLMVMSMVVLGLKILDPMTPAGGSAASMIYHVLVIGTWPVVAFVGYQGGKITFPR